MSCLTTSVNRRRLLEFIAGSPLFMYGGNALADREGWAGGGTLANANNISYGGVVSGA